MTTLTETQIEARVERAMDSLDRRFMAIPEFTQAAYDNEVAHINAWAELAYRNLRTSQQTVGRSHYREYSVE